VSAQNDSVNYFSFQEYCDIVRAHHPLIKQANLTLEKGNSQVLSAKGSFDPTVDANVNQKYFDKNQYYSFIDAGLKIPTWFGIEVYSGFDQNRGLYLNPENNLPVGGLFYAGVSVPLGQDLFIDKRRFILNQAKIYQLSTSAEQQLMINELIYDAGKTYWYWFIAYNKLLVCYEAFEIAQWRAKGVKLSADIGDKPSVDTLEVGIQVQNRKINYYQALIDFEKASAYLSVHLWLEGEVPMEIDSTVYPTILQSVGIIPFNPELTLSTDSLIENHPGMQIYAYKNSSIDLEKRYKQEQLKPEIDLSYNAITENVNGDVFSNYSINNYTWGLQFSSSLFLREERGQLQLTTIKQQELYLDTQMKRQKLLAEVNYALAEWRLSEQQLIVFTKTVFDLELLLESEKTLFMIGESSLFMVNAREMDYINAKLKLIDLMAKNQLSVLGVGYAFGSLK